MKRIVFSLLLPLSFFALSCQKEGKKNAEPPQAVDPMSPENGAPTPALLKTTPLPKPAPEKIIDPVLYCSSGICKTISLATVEKRGLSLIDLSDNYAPYIFSERSSPDEPAKKNKYRQTYVNLGNDRTDEEGKKLTKEEHNYLELFGIPPTLSVIQKRFLNSASEPCARESLGEIFSKLKYSLVYDGSRPKKYFNRFRAARRELQRWAKRKRIKDLKTYLASLPPKKAARPV
ncbi:hypothetical protein KKF84_17955, partial [Myxococcota bacterium]|nr:hypothetical protein [Myxococcota bacterium]MBU1537206.1 hypothetical protein [Myxococcota bacterium]